MLIHIINAIHIKLKIITNIFVRNNRMIKIFLDTILLDIQQQARSNKTAIYR